MKAAFKILLPWAPWLLLAGCASEGGVSGTGISAIVAGHVTRPDGSAAAGVTVLAEQASATTGADGNFEIVGEFSEHVELEFAEAGAGASVGTVGISVPAGSTTILEEITIDSGAARPVTVNIVRHGSVVGRIESVSCDAAPEIAMTLANGAAFTFRLSDEVVVRDRAERPIDCEDLRAGDRIEASGVQLSDGSSLAFSVDVTRRRAEARQEFAVEFGGSVNNRLCDKDRIRVLVLTEADPFIANVRIGDATDLFCVDAAGPRSCDCEDITRRDIVQVRGVVSVVNPGAVVASSIYVFPGPAVVEVPVVALRVKCRGGKIETEAVFETTHQVVVARFADDTEFVCDGEPCACQDLRAGDLLHVRGSPIVASGRPFIDVSRITRIGE